MRARRVSSGEPEMYVPEGLAHGRTSLLCGLTAAGAAHGGNRNPDLGVGGVQLLSGGPAEL